MSRNWDKYIHKNKYSECQLITALNAYYCLTGKQYCKQDSQEYEDLVDLVCARNGAAIQIKKVWDILGIETIWGGISLSDLGSEIRLPIEFSVWAKGWGFHSTLIVDYVKKCDAYRITNFKGETSIKGWVFGEDLYKSESFHFHREYESYRLFGLKGDKNNDTLKRRWKRNRKRFLEEFWEE